MRCHLRYIPLLLYKAADKGIEPLPAGSEPAALPLRQSAILSLNTQSTSIRIYLGNACGGARTHGLPVKSRLLHQLSYTRLMRIQGIEP